MLLIQQSHRQLTNDVISSEMKIPVNWQGFLESTENKTALTNYYSDQISVFGGQYLSNDQHLYTSGGLGNEAIMATSASMHNVKQLQANQEEADGRIVLHACHNQGKSIVVFIPNTDVLVLCMLCVHHKKQINAEEIYITVKSDLRLLFPVLTLVDKLSSKQHNYANVVCVLYHRLLLSKFLFWTWEKVII